MSRYGHKKKQGLLSALFHFYTLVMCYLENKTNQKRIFRRESSLCTVD